MSLRALFWSRLALGVLSFVFLLLYTAQYRKYRISYAHLADKYSKLLVHSDGLSAQLQLMIDRNQRTEKLLIDLRSKHAEIMKKNNEKQQTNEVQKQQYKDCSAKTVLKNAEYGKFKRRFVDEKDNTSYQNRSFQCQVKLKKLIKQVKELKEKAENQSIIADKCRKLFTTSQPMSTADYVQNGKAHFERLKNMNEELEFWRNLAPLEPPNLSSKKELFVKLQKRSEHYERTPAAFLSHGMKSTVTPGTDENEYNAHKNWDLENIS